MKKMEVTATIEWFGDGFEKSEFTKPTSIYSAQYTYDGKYIMAGGTNKNEVRIFKNNHPEDGYQIVGSVTDLDSACLTLNIAHQSNQFAFGCADGYLRIMNMEEVVVSEQK